MASDIDSKRNNGEAAPAASGRRPRFSLSLASSIRRRIVVINAIGLGVLVAGALYLNQFREGLIDLRLRTLETHGEIIAIAIAETAGEVGAERRLDLDRANAVLRRLAQPSGVRARIFDLSGRLTGDTRAFRAPSAAIDAQPLPPPGEAVEHGALDMLERWYGAAADWVTGPPELYRETIIAGVSADAEVYDALSGSTSSAVRANSEGELIISVSMPIRSFKAVLGALVVSTEGGDIDAVVRAERRALIRVALVATLVSLTLSALLAHTIATPLRRLAVAAERGGQAQARALELRRVVFPDYSKRSDEIGRLSVALRDMIGTIYRQVEAIERFAADVAHEIKNPLTSLRSAVETMRIAKSEDARTRLLEVIEHDVTRLDRLVTDISNASRLDAEMAREEMRRIDLVSMVEGLAAIARDVAGRRGVTVEAEWPTRTVLVHGVESRLGEVVHNLIDNAVSFSPEGGVVRVSLTDSDGVARITVEDQGPGVPEDKLDAVFERFWSERPGHEAFGDHSGLGLSIARQIAQAHGGALTADNARDAEGRITGARFTFDLPL